MAGLDPAIHAAPLDKCLPKMRKLFRVDARVKPGHDDDGDRNVRIKARGRRYTITTAPGYCATCASAVRSVIPSTRAWAISIRSNGSWWSGGKVSRATACALVTAS